MSSISFFFTEAITSCRRAGITTFITIATIGVSLLLMGGFLLSATAVESFLHKLQQESSITLFLSPGVEREQVQALKLRITQFDEVEDAKIVWPQEALNELFTDEEARELLQLGISDEANPLPTTIRITTRSSHDLKQLLAKLKELPSVDKIGYGEEAYRQFQALSELLRFSGILTILLLGAASLFIVANTIRLALYMRREEIVIMKLVGATDWFIRWPFVIEGFLEGILAAIAASMLLILSYNFISVRLNLLLPFFVLKLSVWQIFKLCMKLLMIGMVLGISGSLLSLRDLNSFCRESA